MTCHPLHLLISKRCRESLTINCFPLLRASRFLRPPLYSELLYICGMPLTDSNTASSSSNRGRGKNRGGLGKYLRARGRGHRGAGRPAEFRERLVLDGEQSVDDEDEEAIFEREQRFRKRQLSTNADRYKEEEPELGSDGASSQYVYDNQ
jgi:hypothetical protein